MASVDLIANMLTMIRNAAMVHKDSVVVPVSNINTEILEILKGGGYIEDFRLQEASGAAQKIKVYLKYGIDKKSRIKGIKRVSRSGLRVYTKSRDIAPVLRGLGIAILSTSKGLMTDRQAREQKLGGEVICHVW